MAASTIDMSKFEKESGNTFKGILMIARRGRQINDRYVQSEVHEPEDLNEEELIYDQLLSMEFANLSFHKLFQVG